MKRRIIKIDETKCNGCGICAMACHENAIGMVNGKARLLKDDYCDGLGDCLPACPAEAITFEVREAASYDEAAVKQRQSQNSRLMNWPVQIKLLPITAPYYQYAHLLIAADCTAFSYGNFHGDFLEGKIPLVGCPKLDMVNYAEKLTEILRCNKIAEITLVRMEVPCCRGLERAVESAVKESQRDIPVNRYVVSTEGRLI
ncbi:MAG: ferredoxin [Clostridia bacterium]|nr:ferredoxin [Clostridia bacterium]NCC44834.1 ferredoxin [Clostridia bacterium]